MDLNEFRNELKSLKNIRPSSDSSKSDPDLLDRKDASRGEARPLKSGREIDIDTYCELTATTRSDVWKRVKRGELLAKQNEGQIWVIDPAFLSEPKMDFDDFDPMPAPKRAAASAHAFDQSPPREKEIFGSERSVALPAFAHSELKNNHSEKVEGRESVELALLIDHLSLAKDENREIIRMAQESLERISSMAEKIVAAKELVLREKEARIQEQSQLLHTQKDQIDLLKERIKVQENDVLKLRRDVEDLEILSRSLAEESDSP